jgi:UDP-glucose 4-epimerase
MLTHHSLTPTTPARVVLLGAQGFLARALLAGLAARKMPALALGSAVLDLTATDAADRLAGQLKADDALVMMSAITPDKGRDATALMKNLAMGKAVSEALMRRPVAHAVYVSSDAVYSFDRALVNEESPAAPTDLYGVMHRTRELMLESAVKGPLAVLRPTMVYGAGDSHNSYGPNRFRRMAAKDGKITLGGNGEETRDHIYIDDAAELMIRVLRHRSGGRLNLATGRSVSFRQLAGLVAARGRKAEIVATVRSVPVTHRAFDVTACRKAFPDFVFTPLETGLDRSAGDV